MLSYSDIHCFRHQEDDVTLTSRGYMWTYPGKPLTEKQIGYVIFRLTIFSAVLAIITAIMMGVSI